MTGDERRRLADEIDRHRRASIEEPELRRCCHCREWLPIDLFGAHKWCNPCRRPYAVEYRRRLKAAA